MKRTRIGALILALALIIVLLAGCGSSGASMPMDMALDGYNSAPEKMQVAATEAPQETAGELTADMTLSQHTDINAKLIRTVRLEAQTQNYDALIPSLEEKISALGGYIENREAYNGNIYNDYSNRNCSMVIRIPAERLNEFVDHVNESSNVINTNESVEDVTLQYVDTAARVQALETEQKRLLELLENAQNMTEILEIEARLSDVRYELERHASQLRVYDNLVAYATIYLYIDEVQRLTPVQEPSVFERIQVGFGDTLEDLADGFVNLFVWTAVNSPVLLLWACIITAAWLCLRSIRRRRRKKKAATIQVPKNEETQ